MTELVQEHRCERQTDDHDAGDAAERHEHESEENQEAEVDLDGESKQGPQSPLLEHVGQYAHASDGVKVVLAKSYLFDQLADPPG